MQRQFQTFVIHLGEELHTCQSNACHHRNILQMAHKHRLILRDHSYPDMRPSHCANGAQVVQQFISHIAAGDDQDKQ